MNIIHIHYFRKFNRNWSKYLWAMQFNLALNFERFITGLMKPNKQCNLQQNAQNTRTISNLLNLRFVFNVCLHCNALVLTMHIIH